MYECHSNSLNLYSFTKCGSEMDYPYLPIELEEYHEKQKQEHPHLGGTEQTLV